jgi:hypothetical protein
MKKRTKKKSILINIGGELEEDSVVTQDLYERVRLLCECGYSLVRMFEVGVEEIGRRESGGEPREVPPKLPSDAECQARLLRAMRRKGIEVP